MCQFHIPHKDNVKICFGMKIYVCWGYMIKDEICQILENVYSRL